MSVRGAMPPSDDTTTPVRADVGTALVVLTAFAYAVFRAAHEGFYRGLGTTPEEVGLDYVAIVSRSVVAAAFCFLLLAAAFVTVGSQSLAERLLRRVSPPAAADHRAFEAAAGAVACVAAVIGFAAAVIKFGVIPVGVTAVALAAGQYVKWAIRRANWPRSLATAAFAAPIGLLAIFGSLAAGEAWASRVVHNDGRQPPLAYVAIARWPQPVVVLDRATDSPVDDLAQPPRGSCHPLLIGSSETHYLLLERLDDATSIVRLDTSGVTIRSQLTPVEASSVRRSVCERAVR